MMLRSVLGIAFAGLMLTIPATAQERPPAQPAPAVADGARDFDFEFGDWDAHIVRRLRPLTGSEEWATYDGDSVVRKVWGGDANLGELDVKGPAGRIHGLSLRLYDPQAKRWRIHWSNSADGQIGPAMVGSFAGGHGEFYDAEMLGARSIYVRFIFTGAMPGTKSFRIEQAFSADGGKTWEINWISDFRKRG
jgi:hypothetical protein